MSGRGECGLSRDGRTAKVEHLELLLHERGVDAWQRGIEVRQALATLPGCARLADQTLPKVEERAQERRRVAAREAPVKAERGASQSL